MASGGKGFWEAPTRFFRRNATRTYEKLHFVVTYVLDDGRRTDTDKEGGREEGSEEEGGHWKELGEEEVLVCCCSYRNVL